MATATVPVASSKTAKITPANVSAGSLAAGAPTDPTIQDVLAGPASRIEIIPPSGDSNTVAFLTLSTELHDLIVHQGRAYVAYYAERGRIVRDALNIKLSRAVNKPSREKARANGIQALTATANAACDEASEPSPKPERWLIIHALTVEFPNAVKLPTVNGALALTAVLSRVETPESWDAPERHTVRPRYNRDAVAKLVDRAVGEKMTADAIGEELDRIGGRIAPDAVVKKEADPVASAESLARSTVEKMQEGDIDGFAFFRAFLTAGAEYGYTIAPAKDDNGAQTFKLVKAGH